MYLSSFASSRVPSLVFILVPDLAPSSPPNPSPSSPPNPSPSSPPNFAPSSPPQLRSILTSPTRLNPRLPNSPSSPPGTVAHMPKISDRQKALRDLEQAFLLGVLEAEINTNSSHDSENTSENDSESDEDSSSSSGSDGTITSDSESDSDREWELVRHIYISHVSITESRYFDRPITHRQVDNYFFTTKFYSYTDGEFRQHFRMDKNSFSAIAVIIGPHPVFQNSSRCRQLHPFWQLAVTLERFGHYGNRVSENMLASDFGISPGSVVLCTNRVMTALVSLVPDWIRWPNSQEREKHSRLMRREGFPGCVGFIDGTTIPLSQKPAQEGTAYFDRKQRYSVNAQIVCNMDREIIAVHVGCPGSSSDSKVFSRMDQYKLPEDHFSPGQFLISDSAYGATTFCVPAYKSPEADHPDNTAFNYYLACSRVRNEHCIGVLKGRWQSLKEMRHQLQNDRSMRQLCFWVLSCSVLHNMLAKLGDKWTDPVDARPVASIFDPHFQGTTGGGAFREALKKTTLETNRAQGR
ncbi:nuclease HARBI1 [Entomortierella parvispora]|uniref:Nuclease HARBI1 n=1 Tax=Entomortierella parvispora TaxID=205924 RepID=A0A9P3M0T3_9FUNG|nr:nuclease HARBI1 [Entomortierella parvispora]